MEKSRIKLAALAALLLLVSAAGAFAQDDEFEENLLTNGTADDGLDGWADYDGIWATDRDSSFLVWKFPADGYRGRTLQLVIKVEGE